MFNYILLASFCSTTLEPIQAFLNAILHVCMCAHICILFMRPYVQPVSALFSQRRKYETHLRSRWKHMCCPLSHGCRWFTSCTSHNCKQISHFSSTQTHIWCLPAATSDDFRTIFSMDFLKHMYEWLFPSYSFIFTFCSWLAFCLLPLSFLFSLGMNFAAFSSLYFWSLFLYFSFFFSNLSLVSPFPFLSFFPTSKEVGNLCLPLKSVS